MDVAGAGTFFWAALEMLDLRPLSGPWNLLVSLQMDDSVNVQHSFSTSGELSCVRPA